MLKMGPNPDVDNFAQLDIFQIDYLVPATEKITKKVYKDRKWEKWQNIGCENDNVGEHFDFVVEYINNKNFLNLIWAPSKAAWILACRTYALLVGLTKSINTYLRCVR